MALHFNFHASPSNHADFQGVPGAKAAKFAEIWQSWAKFASRIRYLKNLDTGLRRYECAREGATLARWKSVSGQAKTP